MMIATFALALLAVAQQPSPSPAARAEEVVHQLTSGDFAAIEARFNDAMTAALPPGKLATTWSSLIAQAGAFQRVTGSGEETSGGYQIGVVTCAFERATLDVRVVFDKDAKIAGLNMRPAAAPASPHSAPSYADPASFTESDISVGTGEWKLPGTLTVPKGDGPFPALVLIHGSGPNDRDETIGPNKPFADLAAGLASLGIAVLRFDKRSKVYGGRMAASGDITSRTKSSTTPSRRSPPHARTRISTPSASSSSATAKAGCSSRARVHWRMPSSSRRSISPTPMAS
jgi:hypothetical protein